MGAYNPKGGEVIVPDYERINGEGMIDFLNGLRRRNGEKRLYILKYDNICHFVCEKYVKTSPYCGICWQIFTVTSIVLVIMRGNNTPKK
jgi:hypothetical protein